VLSSNPGHFEPFGMETISLSRQAAAIPQLILVGAADAVAGTQRPYAYFRRHLDRGAPWTFVVQNNAPHCCIMNAKALVLAWLDEVLARRPARATAWHGFIETTPSAATDCPGQSPPVRSSWCRGTHDAWAGGNWSVTRATIDRRATPPPGMMPAGWLPTDVFAKALLSFVTQPEDPVTLPP
jgi:hypothetical protein